MLGLGLVIFTTATAQNPASSGDHSRKLPLVMSVFQQATLLPGAGGMFGLFHPGVSAGTEFRYNKSTVNQWFQTAKIGVAYHQYVQTSIQLYSEAGYRRMLWRGIGVEGRVGTGYLHSIPGVEVFRLKDGVYENKPRIGRPQVMFSGAAGAGYTLRQGAYPPRFFVDYQFYIQAPFVKQYVPLVPTTAVHAGVAISIINKRK